MIYMFDKKLIIMTRWCMLYCIAAKTTRVIYFIQAKALEVFWHSSDRLYYLSLIFLVNSRYLFLQQLYIFIYCPYMLDMCFSKILFKQSWKKRRLYHTQPWFILGVRLCTFISFVQCLTYITHIRVKDNWMLKVAFKMPSIIFRH